MKTPDSRQDTNQAPGTRKAVYVRMSRGEQQYSIGDQLDVIRKYAARRGVEIVMT
jgi:DNA invertase Pin-like site-specific DNA recombinase